jgi:hypothetical protein
LAIFGSQTHVDPPGFRIASTNWCRRFFKRVEGDFGIVTIRIAYDYVK